MCITGSSEEHSNLSAKQKGDRGCLRLHVDGRDSLGGSRRELNEVMEMFSFLIEVLVTW